MEHTALEYDLKWVGPTWTSNRMLRTTADLRRTEGLASRMGGWSSIRRTATDGRGRGAVVFLHAGGSNAALSQGTGMNKLEVGVVLQCN